MKDLPRRRLDEVIARYKLEPTLDDIYVEGSFDKKILDKAFSELNIHRPVYEIDTVDISDETLNKHGLSRGEKQELIALCSELDLGKESRVVCLVDRDMDNYTGTIISKPGLVYTFYSDLEGVFLSKDTVRELFCDAGGVACNDWEQTFTSLEEAVKAIFALRLALKESDHTAALPPLSKSLTKVGETVVVDMSNMVIRANCHLLSQEDLKARVDHNYTKIAHVEARHAGRGHDYIEILGWLIKKLNGHKGIAESLDKILILLAPRFADVLVEPLR